MKLKTQRYLDSTMLAQAVDRGALIKYEVERQVDNFIRKYEPQIGPGKPVGAIKITVEWSNEFREWEMK